MAFTPSHTYEIEIEGRKIKGNIVLDPAITFEYDEVSSEGFTPSTTQYAAVKTFLTAVNTLYDVFTSMRSITIKPVRSTDTDTTDISGA